MVNFGCKLTNPAFLTIKQIIHRFSRLIYEPSIKNWQQYRVQPRRCDAGHIHMLLSLSSCGDPTKCKVFVRDTKCQGHLISGRSDVYMRNVVYRHVMDDC